MNPARTPHTSPHRLRSLRSLLLACAATFLATTFGGSHAQAGAQQTIPLNLLSGALEPVRGDDPVLPDELIATSHGKTLVGSYRICVKTSGSVLSVTPLISIAGADQVIKSVLKAWKFQKLPVAICKTQTFMFDVQ